MTEHTPQALPTRGHACHVERGVMCTTCDHPPHEGRRCFMPITKERSTYKDGLIFSHIETVGNCACGLLDSLLETLGIDADTLGEFYGADAQ